MIKSKTIRILTMTILIALICCTALIGCTVKLGSFNISFYDGDTEYISIKATELSIVELPAEPTKLGHQFDGWYFDKDVWADEFTANDFLKSREPGDKKVYAKWLATSHTLSFESDNGSVIADKVVIFGEHYKLDVLTKDLYTFLGWMNADNELLTDAAGASIAVWSGGKNQTLTAKWLGGSYTVAFESDNGSVVADKEVILGAHYNLDVPTKANYAFLGWMNADNELLTDGTGASKVVWAEPSNQTLTAKWLGDSYTVAFESDNGSVVADKEVIFGDHYKLDVPTKAGYTFLGWMNSDSDLLTDAAGASIAVWSGVKNETFTAKWLANSYTLSFQSDNGSVVDDKEVIFGSHYNLDVPTKAGYAFLGWMNADNALLTDGTGASKAVLAEPSNQTLTAKWELVTYWANFVQKYSSRKVSFTIVNTRINEPRLVEPKGYTGVWEEYEIVTRDITINAVYTIIDYKIEYIDNGGAGNLNPTTYNVETETIVLKGLTRLCSEFTSWINTTDKVIVEILKGSLGDVELVATYTRKHKNTATDCVCPDCNVSFHTFIGECKCQVCNLEMHNIIDGACNMCMDRDGYFLDGADLYFGEYPQTIKGTDVLISGTVDSDGYYTGSDGFKYAKQTSNRVNHGHKFTNGDVIITKKVYYFKIMPIKWKILDSATGLIICDSAIQAGRFTSNSNVNAWNGSAVQKWLNEDFYSKAFSSKQTGLIKDTFNADISSTDKVYLLSKSEFALYKLGEKIGDTFKHIKIASDYARSKEYIAMNTSSCYGSSSWWLRTPSSSKPEYVYNVLNGGIVGEYAASNANRTIVPTLRMNLPI